MEEIKKIYQNFKKHEIGDFAAQSAFFTVLSIIPFSIIFISTNAKWLKCKNIWSICGPDPLVRCGLFRPEQVRLRHEIKGPGRFPQAVFHRG